MDRAEGLDCDNTVICKLFPYTIHTADAGLSTEEAFRADLTGDSGYLTGESLELIHHLVDGAFERGDFRVHFYRIHANLHGQIAAGDGGDDGTDLSEGLLEGLVGLLMLP